MHPHLAAADSMLPDLTGGILFVVLAIVLFALSLYWLFFPWFVYQKLNKVIEHLAHIDRNLRTMPAAAAAAVRVEPPPLVTPAMQRYFVANGEEVSGPFSMEQIRHLQAKGVITAETHVTAEGQEPAAWRPVSTIL